MIPSRPLRRPELTEKIAGSLEELLKHFAGIQVPAKARDAVEFCSKLLTHHQESSSRRADVRQRISGIRKTKPTTKAIEHNGETKPLVAWAKELGFSYSTIYERLRRGKTFAEAIAQKRGRERE